MNVRPFIIDDKTDFINICAKTAGNVDPASENGKFITELYCNYYTENEPQNCFALTDENNKAVGYIICSESYAFYKKNMKSTLNHIRSLGINHYFSTLGEIIGHGLYKKNYSAHLHIDILPEFQHSGGGTMLMNTLKNHLKSKGINSVHLMVNAENKNAVKFYKKNGFGIHHNFKKFYVMTCNF